MSSLTAFAVRIARLAALRRSPIKENVAEALAQRMAEYFCGAHPTPEAIANIGADQILDRLKWYREQSNADIFLNPLSPIEKLERANEMAAAQKRADGVGATPRKREGMTPEQRAEFASLPAHLKMAWADGTLLNREFRND